MVEFPSIEGEIANSIEPGMPHVLMQAPALAPRTRLQAHSTSVVAVAPRWRTASNQIRVKMAEDLACPSGNVLLFSSPSSVSSGSLARRVSGFMWVLPRPIVHHGNNELNDHTADFMLNVDL